MLTPYDIRLIDLRRDIRAFAAGAPEWFQKRADHLANLEIADIDERLMTCETTEDEDKLLGGWIHVWGTPV